MSAPETQVRGWRDRAACRGSDAELFFPAAEEGSPAYLAQVAVAKAVCASCPVRAECLDEALARIPDGIAGGLTPAERRHHRLAATTDRPTSRETAVLNAGLRHGARAAEVRAAGRVLLAAGRPIHEVARHCGVTQRTAQRWATTSTASSSTARTSGAGEGRGGNRALPLISHTSPQAGTHAEGHRG